LTVAEVYGENHCPERCKYKNDLIFVSHENNFLAWVGMLMGS